MGDDCLGDTDIEVLSSMWPDDLGTEARKQFNIEKPGVDRDMLEEVTIIEEPSVLDFESLIELTNYSEKGSSQLAYLVKHWEYKQANAVRLLNEELNILNKQRQEVELKKLEILEEHRFEEGKHVGDKRSISILDEEYDIWQATPSRNDVLAYIKDFDMDTEYDTIKYWKQRAVQLDKMLEASIKREQRLMQKLQENIKDLETQSSPVEELSQILKRADNFLHFILQNAPVVIGHQDKELRYRFIYNHFPSLEEEDIIGRTDTEIFSGAGVKESQDFKKEVLERGLPAKREITFETELFGSKTFLIYVEPVFSKAGDRIGVNYMGMDITDQVIKREKMATLREEIAVQNAKETELSKTIHITEETMRAKQMLATMSHEIRSPLTGVVSMAEILATTKLDKEQRQLLDVMLSSGDLVLQLINDILDLSKVESGVMKLEATKFRPREVVKHVLQTAAASLQKELTLEGHVADNVPVEVIGDVLRIRQILTNLISNAIKFAHEGKVGINLHVVSKQYVGGGGEHHQVLRVDNSAIPATRLTEEVSTPESCYDLESSHCLTSQDPDQYNSPVEKASLTDADTEEHHQPHEKIVWLCCDIYDTGIGIPEKALPSLFKKYMQVSADHARKYGGTGLGLAICKQLVELMGGHLSVTSREHCGSTFTFVLPYKVSSKQEYSDDPGEVSAISDRDVIADDSTDEISGFFVFKPRTLGTLFSSCGSIGCRKKLLSGSSKMDALNTLNELAKESDSFSSSNYISGKTASVEDVSPISDATESLPELEGLAKHGLDYDIYNSETIIRRDEESHDVTTGFFLNNFHSSSTDSSRIQSVTSSQHCTMTCTEVANTAENSKCKLTCHNLRHEKGDRNFQRTSTDSSELSKIKLQSKILLVEDNMINVTVAQSMMKRLGYNINVVNNGLEAIHAVQRSSYDLILMDVCMPIMDGLQATRLIRSFEERGYWDALVETENDQALHCSDPPASSPDVGRCRKRIPIIAMTANALAESVDDCLANGMDSFVSKPVTFQKLKQCLQQYFPC